MLIDASHVLRAESRQTAWGTTPRADAKSPFSKEYIKTQGSLYPGSRSGSGGGFVVSVKCGGSVINARSVLLLSSVLKCTLQNFLTGV